MGVLGALARRLRRALGIEESLRLRRQELKVLRDIARDQRRVLDTVDRIDAHQLMSIHAEVAGYLQRHQLGELETLAKVRNERLSLARFGDGEFTSMLKRKPLLSFQRPTPALAADLYDVLRLEGYAGVRLLVALPAAMLDSTHWRRVWGQYWPWLKQVLRDDIAYGNATISRPYFLDAHGQAAIDAWRAVWDGEDICVLTGKGSRFDLVDALFSNAASTRFLYSTPVDAHEDLPRLIAQVLAEVPKTTLCLIALGPAGTVLAAKLAREGYWAVDTGHLPNSFTKVHEGAPQPEKLPLVRD